MAFCQSCGKGLDNGAAFCGSCGNKVGTVGAGAGDGGVYNKSDDTELEDLSIFGYYKKCLFKKYATFDGRARRKEYWGFFFSNWLISLFCIIIAAGMTVAGINGIGTFLLSLYVLYSFFLIIPFLAAMVRRFHDTGRSGAYLFWWLVPFVGTIIVFIALCTESSVEENQYGPNPKADFYN